MAKNELNTDEVKELISEFNLEIVDLTQRDDLLIVDEFEKNGNIFFAGIAIYNEERDKEVTTIYKLTKHIKKEIQSIKQIIIKIKL